jgi:hypothetical protein
LLAFIERHCGTWGSTRILSNSAGVLRGHELGETSRYAKTEYPPQAFACFTPWQRAGPPRPTKPTTSFRTCCSLRWSRGARATTPRFLAWASGVLRHRALFLARTAGRRRHRETDYHAAEYARSAAGERKLPRQFVESLPPSLQIIARLANAGLGRAEIGSLLDISDTALRQRISGLRQAWKQAGVAPELREIGPQNALPGGLLRRALKTSLRKLPGGRLAIADPDGHPIFFSGTAHKPPAVGN